MEPKRTCWCDRNAQQRARCWCRSDYVEGNAPPMRLSNVPDEVYLVALDLMGQPRPVDPRDACRAHDSAASRVDYEPILASQGEGPLIPLTAFAAALAMYLSLSGPFDEEHGEFAGLGGCEIG